MVMSTLHGNGTAWQPLPPAIKLDELLADEQLAHLSDALSKENTADWLTLTRPALLQHLKEIGVTSLSERQRVANALGRRRRAITNALSPAAESALPAAKRPVSEVSPMQHRPARSLSHAVFDSASDWPDGERRRPTEAVQKRVRRMLLSGAATYQVSGGAVRVARPQSSSRPLNSQTDAWQHLDSSQTAVWTEPFGECADSSCGCYRLSHPERRAHFRNLVVSRTAEVVRRQVVTAVPEMADGHRRVPGVGYVSIGCGSLLTDFEILCGLCELGLAPATILLCDTVYSSASFISSTAVENEHLKRFRTLAAFFHPARACGMHMACSSSCSSSCSWPPSCLFPCAVPVCHLWPLALHANYRTCRSGSLPSNRLRS